MDSPSKRDSAQARKMHKNAGPTPSRVHAVLGGVWNSFHCEKNASLLNSDQEVNLAGLAGRASLAPRAGLAPLAPREGVAALAGFAGPP